MKTIFITGASGFIGGHLTRVNLEKGNRVRALVLPDDPGRYHLEQSGVELILGDLRDGDTVRKGAQGADIIFHCAAVVTDWAPMRLFEEVTVGGTENVCRAAVVSGVSRLVKISTNDVFGLDEDVVMDENSPLKTWGEPYPDTKIRAEKMAWKYYREEGLPVTMVYPCWAYGEGDLTFVPLLADAIIKGEMMFWRRDVIVWPTYIDNLIDLLLLIAEDERAVGNGYLVHDGESTTLQEFCASIARALQVKPPRLHIPYAAAYTMAVLLEGLWKLLRRKKRPLLTTYTVKNLGSRLRFSIEKAERELGWKPIVSFADGLTKTLDWVKTLDLDNLKQK